MISSILKYFKKINLATAVLILVIILSAFLRFYKLNCLRHFTYDQARDALFIKRIIIDHKFRLIGTQSSIPGLYTPPFYYYLMVPFLLAFKLNPLGIDFATAFFGLLSIILLYLILLKLKVSSVLSLVISSLYAFHPVVVYQSRFAWNPNTMPFFILLGVFSFIKIIEDRDKLLYYFLLFFSMGMSISLHYSGVIYSICFILLLIFCLKRLRIKNILFGLGTFIFTICPLFIFDLRHQFINSKGIINYFLYNTRNEGVPPPFFAGLLDKYKSLISLIFLPDINIILVNIFLIISALLLIFFALKQKKEILEKSMIFLFLSMIFFSSFYSRGFYSFYLTFLYPFPFIIFGVVLSKILKNEAPRPDGRGIFSSLLRRERHRQSGIPPWRENPTEAKNSSRSFPILRSGFSAKEDKIILIFSIILLLLLAGRNFVASLNQIKTENICLESKLIPVAAFLSNKVNSSSNLISIYSGSERFGYNAVDYKYFLEAFYGKKLLDWDPSDYKNSNEIFLISEAGEIDPLKLNIWELTIFEPKKVAEKWKIGDIHVYHLLK